MADLRELLKRVEAAHGPDRELDFAIHAMLVDPPPAPSRASDVRLPDGFGKDVMSMAMDPRPRYTASIDAALALIERKFDGSAKYPVEMILTSAGNKGPWRCAIWVGADDTDGIYRAAPTAPLAVLAATIKALIAIADQPQ